MIAGRFNNGTVMSLSTAFRFIGMVLGVLTSSVASKLGLDGGVEQDSYAFVLPRVCLVSLMPATLFVEDYVACGVLTLAVRFKEKVRAFFLELPKGSHLLIESSSRTNNFEGSDRKPPGTRPDGH